MKNIYFPETVAACGLKVGRCIQQDQLRKQMSVKGQGHFFILANVTRVSKLNLVYLENYWVI